MGSRNVDIRDRMFLVPFNDLRDGTNRLINFHESRKTIKHIRLNKFQNTTLEAIDQCKNSNIRHGNFTPEDELLGPNILKSVFHAIPKLRNILRDQFQPICFQEVFISAPIAEGTHEEIAAGIIDLVDERRLERIGRIQAGKFGDVAEHRVGLRENAAIDFQDWSLSVGGCGLDGGPGAFGQAVVLKRDLPDDAGESSWFSSPLFGVGVDGLVRVCRG